MKQRVIFWGSVILAVGGIVCTAVCMSAEGGANIALWIAALVLIALGVIGLSLTRYGDSKRRSAKYEREREEERAAYEGAKYLSVLYGGRKERMGAPTHEDTLPTARSFPKTKSSPSEKAQNRQTSFQTHRKYRRKQHAGTHQVYRRPVCRG